MYTWITEKIWHAKKSGAICVRKIDKILKNPKCHPNENKYARMHICRGPLLKVKQNHFGQ